MPITQQQLEEGLYAIRNQYSDNPTIDIDTARRNIAKQEAQLISDFVIGRSTTVNVTGTSVSGGAISGTGTGIIK